MCTSEETNRASQDRLFSSVVCFTHRYLSSRSSLSRGHTGGSDLSSREAIHHEVAELVIGFLTRALFRPVNH